MKNPTADQQKTGKQNAATIRTPKISFFLLHQTIPQETMNFESTIAAGPRCHSSWGGGSAFSQKIGWSSQLANGQENMSTMLSFVNGASENSKSFTHFKTCAKCWNFNSWNWKSCLNVLGQHVIKSCFLIGWTSPGQHGTWLATRFPVLFGTWWFFRASSLPVHLGWETKQNH